ncbi:MAG: MBL fold metallo-hydrolase [Oceanicaulis sp.]|uniref:MBL fold metallo-hydrolase n=1 Tax=Oceanicaulis sp. UBA2681 TaxID=1947007 RepID=UPI000C0A1494|nr:MBL fold metallo-hydrolase [Oceanicaulis sp. UBA2681]MAP49652.1 MBL fold metallo-hydrolase [Oceanicaulis sp.]HCR66989.1 MBL fold metallo-hydrolase [Oceanicaulis sp.]|tara:strand:+ start:12651 stop:13538 length:888 start_codon:yes stop_codon:yes gene_type:complete
MTTDNASSQNPVVKAFFDRDTFTVSYVVSDPATSKAAIIDSVLDYDPKSGRTAHKSADALIAYVREQGLDVDWVLETHVHADHLSAAPYLKAQLGGQLAIGANIRAVQSVFGDVFNAEDEFRRDGSQFDHLFADDERFYIGELEARAMHTPGHTPACMTYVIGDAAFVGDTLFMPDFGTARCDFPGGDARTLYRSIQKIFALPDETRLFMCHDYKAPGRDDFAWESTVAEERASNIHVGGGVDEDSFVAMRERRDATLDMPNLILPSVQVNMRAGELPPAEDNGVHYLKIPFDAL